MKKIIYLSGGSGMVGRNIIDHNESNNYKILSPKSSDLNLLNYKNIENFISDNRPDIIIHTAGVVGGIQANIDNPTKFLVENLQMGINILTVSKKMNVKNFINLSSSIQIFHYQRIKF